MKFLVVTAVGRNLLAETLERSILEFHPDAQLYRLLADARTGTHPPCDDSTAPCDDSTAPGRVQPQDLDFDGLRWADLVLAFGRRRAGWASLGWVLEHLVDSGELGAAEPVVVLEDTFEVFGPLTDLWDRDTGAGGTVTAARARRCDPDLGAWAGFVPGLLVTAGSPAHTRWWKDRVLEQIVSEEPLVSVDAWWDLPLGTHGFTDPTLCLSATTAPYIHLDSEMRLPDGRRPTLVDFSGLDPERPWLFTVEDDPGVDAGSVLGTSPGLRRLLGQRAALLTRHPLEPRRTEPIMAGVEMTPEIRTWYRGLLAERSTRGLPPNPLVCSQVRPFVELLGGPGDPDGSGAGRHVDLLFERRADLQRAFAHPRWRDRRSLGRWLWSHGLSEGETSLLTLADPPAMHRAARVAAAPLPFGVNLVGYLGAELGLGVAVRAMQKAFDAAGIPNSPVSYDRTSSHHSVGSSGEMHAPYQFNLLVITPDQLPLFVDDVGVDFLAGHHNIGLWYWESDVIAPQHSQAFQFVDEVWVATNYLTRAFGSVQRVPVRVVPSPLVFDVSEIARSRREDLGLDDRFTFLFSFDFLSVAERKNPLGLVDAYCRAFPDPRGDTRLLLKSINGHLFPGERARIIWEIAERDDIELRDQLLSAQDRLALVAQADCYVSLHRSEGLGLTMAEAMAVGTPVIATEYSGNLDFMVPGSALFVPAEEVAVGPGHYYPAEGHWAAPDLDAAAAMMRRVHQDSDLRGELARAGRAALAPFSYEAVGATARNALLEAWDGEARGR